MDKKSFKPEFQSIYEIHDFVKKYLISKNSYTQELSATIDLIIEEVVVNIINYGLKDISKGIINVEVNISGKKLNLKISDNGIPFNPLEAPGPDINASLEDRGIGGLGIFLVKQKSNAITYSRKNSMNELSITL